MMQLRGLPTDVGAVVEGVIALLKARRKSDTTASYHRAIKCLVTFVV
jgi:hypothetical protein